MEHSEKNQATVEIKISGMSCNHCVQHIEKALKQTRGVKMARVDLNEEKATIEYDPSAVNEAELLQAIKDSGYEGILSDN